MTTCPNLHAGAANKSADANTTENTKSTENGIATETVAFSVESGSEGAGAQMGATGHSPFPVPVHNFDAQKCGGRSSRGAI